MTNFVSSQIKLQTFKLTSLAPFVEYINNSHYLIGIIYSYAHYEYAFFSHKLIFLL